MAVHTTKTSATRRFVSQCSQQALHGIAGKFNRMRALQDLSEQQEWLYDLVVAELEHRCRQALKQAPWTACTCYMCLPLFPSEDAYGEGDAEFEEPPASRPDGAPISKKPPKHPTHREPEQEQPQHGWEDVPLPFDPDTWRRLG